MFDLNAHMSLSLEKKLNNANVNVNKQEIILKKNIEENKQNENLPNKPVQTIKKSNDFDKNYIVKHCSV